MPDASGAGSLTRGVGRYDASLDHRCLGYAFVGTPIVGVRILAKAYV